MPKIFDAKLPKKYEIARNFDAKSPKIYEIARNFDTLHQPGGPVPPGPPTSYAYGWCIAGSNRRCWSPVAFFSRRFNDTQKHYRAFDGELLAAFSAVKHLQYFVECKQFVLFSDHKPLVKAFSHRSSQAIPRRACQMAFIAEFGVLMKHIEGSANFTADALSRVEITVIVSFRLSLT